MTATARAAAGEEAPVPAGLVWRAFAPLAASWVLMALEQPLIAAAIARLPDARVQLAAWGGLVFPVALVVEAPILMMLTASTSLVHDRASYRHLRRIVHGMGLALTALHLLIVATPLFDAIAEAVLRAPAPTWGPGRIGLALMLPWSWAIAWRRFNQGVLIRHGRGGDVGRGTALRLVAIAVVLALGLATRALSGIALAGCAIAVGVISEALYAEWAAQRVVRTRLQHDDPERRPLVGRAFVAFYGPLALTPLVALLSQPLGAAAMGRMPDALASLAVWPVLNGLVFVLQSLSLAASEVVVSFLGQPGARAPLGRFVGQLALGTSGVLALIALTPLGTLWFAGVSGLAPDLVELARTALLIAIPVPAMRALQSWYQGNLVHERTTAAITEAVVLFLAVCGGLLAAGVHGVSLGLWSAEAAPHGLHVALWAISAGRLAQTLWLALRATALRRRAAAATV